MSEDAKPVRSKRGFACMDPEKLRALASAGGKKSHALGVGHEWTTEKAREAGRKGGMVSRERKLRAAELKQPWLPNVTKVTP